MRIDNPEIVVLWHSDNDPGRSRVDTVKPRWTALQRGEHFTKMPQGVARQMQKNATIR
jgi:hypothetical protein